MMYARHGLGIRCIRCYAQPSIWKLDVLGVTHKARVRLSEALDDVRKAHGLGIKCITCYAQPSIWKLDVLGVTVSFTRCYAFMY